MPIDASIPLQARGLQIRDPLETYGNALAIQGRQQENALRSMQMQQAQRAYEEDQAGQNALRSYYGSDRGEDALRSLAQASPKLFAQEQKRMLEEQDKRSEITKRSSETTKISGEALDKALGRYRNDLDLIDSPQRAIGWLKAQYSDPVTGPHLQRLGSYEQAVAAIPNDPQQFQEWRQRSAMGMEKYISNMTTQRGQNMDSADRRRGQNLEYQGKVDAAKASAGNKDFERSDKLRDEFQKGSGEFIKVRDAFERLTQAAAQPSAAGDLALIFNYMKMLDPGSVVREGEFATAQNAAGIPDRIRNVYNKAISGERLNEAQRKDFVSQAERQYKGSLKGQEQLEGQYRKYSETFGVNPSNVVTDYRINRPQPGAPAGGSNIDALLEKYK